MITTASKNQRKHRIQDFSLKRKLKHLKKHSYNGFKHHGMVDKALEQQACKHKYKQKV
jgi:hypothetical protein